MDDEEAQDLEVQMAPEEEPLEEKAEDVDAMMNVEDAMAELKSRLQI